MDSDLVHIQYILYRNKPIIMNNIIHEQKLKLETLQVESNLHSTINVKVRMILGSVQSQCDHSMDSMD